MNDHPPEHHAFPAPTGAHPMPSASHAAAVDGIVAGAMSATVKAPAPTRSARRRANRVERAHQQAAIPHGGRGGSNQSAPMRLLALGLLALLGLGAVAYMAGAFQFGPPGTGPTGVEGGTERDGAWSYYHDRDYDSSTDGAKWSTDRTRSSDPDEAVLGDTSRWEYDGPYRYGSYGSDGMRRRAAGRESADPLYSQPAPGQDVFRQYGGNLDPSGGQPVGAAPSSMSNPYYDPYTAGYSNPYANRIRMAYGEGVGRGASYDPTQ